MEEGLLHNNGGSSVERSKWENFLAETKKLSYIAVPMVVVTVSQHLSRVVSIIMVGHLGELPLSGAAIATSFTNVTGLSLLFGMASGLETLCGQSFGANQHHKLGIYTYAAIISLIAVCIPISILWFFMDKLLIFTGQDPLISVEAGRYTFWLIPSLFPYAILQSLVRYLQTQSLTFPMLLSSVAALFFHIPICWALVFILKMGSTGAALAISLSYWFNVILLVLYVKYSSVCEKTRVVFSGEVFPSMKEFFYFAASSGTMVCLEWWSSEIIVLLSGFLPNPQLETSVLSICLLIASLHYFIPYSIGAAVSTRVSNELGAGHPESAKASTFAAIFLSILEAIIACTILVSLRNSIGYAFSNEKEVVNHLQQLTPFVCLLLSMDCIQSVLSGVARGCGWQHLGAYVNLGAYYLAGLPMAVILGFALHFQGKGLWFGLNIGSIVQAVLLSIITCFTNWKHQALMARERIFEGTDSGLERI